MNKFPPFLQRQRFRRSVCLILEGYEEYYYFKKLLTLGVFSPVYDIRLINAKSASSIPAKYQDALAGNSYSIVLIVCDRDRKPQEYLRILRGIEDIVGNGRGEEIITFTRPCTLQVILYHFGEAALTTQAKRAARADVLRLTGVADYDAHQAQLNDICSKIHRKSWDAMRERLKLLSANPDDIPSSNMGLLFERLCADDFAWIDDLNKSILARYNEATEMPTIMYGTKNCPDVRSSLAETEAGGLDIEFRSFDGSVTNLKEFIRLRDSRAEFDEIKKNGLIGIPCFVTEEGKICFDISEVK
ncbi:MAG: hypothetical protein Q4D58_05025 [Synergistaceae bacterium]|nr:hypothetical protein [Synergistaceae bacterium]